MTIQKQSMFSEIEKILRCHFADNLLAIYIFGSSITEYETKTSDVDIAIMCKTKINKLALWEVAQTIASKIKKDVDLLDLRSVSTVMQMQVITTGKRIYCTDNMTVEKYEDFIFSSYVHLNEARKGILEDIKTRGSIYG